MINMIDQFHQHLGLDCRQLLATVTGALCVGISRVLSTQVKVLEIFNKTQPWHI